jgi:hypothetical protein
VLAKHNILCWDEDAVESAEYRQGQHDTLVLRRPVRTTEQVCYLPDQVCMFVVVGYGAARSLGFRWKWLSFFLIFLLLTVKKRTKLYRWQYTFCQWKKPL